jgi:hypothetical protein
LGVYLDILADDIDVIGSLNNFIEPDDVRMHEETQDLYLSPHCDARPQSVRELLALEEDDPRPEAQAP